MTRTLAVLAVMSACIANACTGGTQLDGGDASSDVMRASWNCPADWVPASIGGCGPAVVLCAVDGGAATGVCTHIDITTPRAVSDGDGGSGTSLYRSPDGRLRGGWHEENDPTGRARIGSATIRVDYDAQDHPVPSGRSVAYGTHAGAGCTVDVTQGVFSDGGYGVFASSGTLSLHQGVIAYMHDGAGARSGAAPLLDHVGFVGNARDVIVERGDLPDGAILQSPQPACTTPNCL